MPIRYQLWLKFHDGTDVVIEDVEEFEPGFRYLFVRSYDGGLQSFKRDTLASVSRRTSPDRDWIPVLMRKPKRYPASSETYDSDASANAT
jgi:hypothetical protein